MYVVMTIAGDPTSWWTKSLTGHNELATELAHGPASVAVFYPVIGNLLISARASVAILDVPPTVSWVPSGAQAPVATLYVQAGPTSSFSGYPLPVGTNLADLAERIKTAMGGPTAVTVPISSGSDSGVAVVNGASLTYAVICPPPPPS